MSLATHRPLSAHLRFLISVPKDYLNSTAGTATVALARSRAPSGRSKGSVFLNPGSSNPFPVYPSLLNTRRQAVPVDPESNLSVPRPLSCTRSSAQTGTWSVSTHAASDALCSLRLSLHAQLRSSVPSPLVQCFPDGETESLLYENTILHQGWTVPNTTHVTDPLNKLALMTQARQFLAIKEAQALLCHENMDVGDLKYMGTTTVVRDIDFMTRVLDGPEAKMYDFPSYLFLIS